MGWGQPRPLGRGSTGDKETVPVTQRGGGHHDTRTRGDRRPARRGDKCPFLQRVLRSSKHIQGTQPGALGCPQSPGTGARAHRAQPPVWLHRDGHRALDTIRAQRGRQGCHLPTGLSSREEGDHPIPTSMGMGQAATGLGKEERKMPARDLGKKLPKEGLEEEGVEAPSQGAWGTGRAGDARAAPGWGAATNSRGLFQVHFPPRPLTTKL